LGLDLLKTIKKYTKGVYFFAYFNFSFGQIIINVY